MMTYILQMTKRGFRNYSKITLRLVLLMCN
nr:MAG TPA: hypothetical protein [Caudoviricetes sp.]